MKGIKVCINWMLDNPMKEITNGEVSYRFNDIHSIFAQRRQEYSWLPAYGMEKLNECEWEEVKQPYTFSEARDMIIDCHPIIFDRGSVQMRYDYKAKDISLEWSDDVIKNIKISLGGEWFKR